MMKRLALSCFVPGARTGTESSNFGFFVKELSEDAICLRDGEG